MKIVGFGNDGEIIIDIVESRDSRFPLILSENKLMDIIMTLNDYKISSFRIKGEYILPVIITGFNTWVENGYLYFTPAIVKDINDHEQILHKDCMISEPLRKWNTEQIAFKSDGLLLKINLDVCHCNMNSGNKYFKLPYELSKETFTDLTLHLWTLPHDYILA